MVTGREERERGTTNPSLPTHGHWGVCERGEMDVVPWGVKTPKFYGSTAFQLTSQTKYFLCGGGEV